MRQWKRGNGIRVRKIAQGRVLMVWHLHALFAAAWLLMNHMRSTRLPIFPQLMSHFSSGMLSFIFLDNKKCPYIRCCLILLPGTAETNHRPLFEGAFYWGSPPTDAAATHFLLSSAPQKWSSCGLPQRLLCLVVLTWQMVYIVHCSRQQHCRISSFVSWNGPTILLFSMKLLWLIYKNKGLASFIFFFNQLIYEQ